MCRRKLGDKSIRFTILKSRTALRQCTILTYLRTPQTCLINCRCTCILPVHVTVRAKSAVYKLSQRRFAHPYFVHTPHLFTTDAHALRALPERRDQRCLQIALLLGFRQPCLVRNSMECLCDWLHTTVCGPDDVIFQSG